MSIPANIIIIWSGAINEIPNGWLLCDGQNNTPDLRNRFIVGVGSKYTLEEIGGSANSVNIEHTHSTSSTNSVASHTHTISTGRPDQFSGPITAFNIIRFFRGDFGRATNQGGAHTHSFNTTNAGQSGINRNMPPYIALGYIMFGGE